jgi:hypothetical protein
LKNERSLFWLYSIYVTQINFFPFSNKLLSQIPLKPLKILACYSLPISHLIPFFLIPYFLKSFHSSIFRAKNENKVLLGLRVKGEGLRRDFTHFSFHFLFHSIF